MENLRTNNLSGEGGRNAYNGSVFFDGTENRLDIAHSTDFDIADANTFECWIYYHSLPTNNLFLGIESSYWIGYNHTGIGGASNKFVFSIYNGSAWQAVSSSTTPAVRAWHHVAATKDGTSLKIYINGVLENTTTMSGTAANNSDLFNIGRWNDASAGDGVRGYISNLRVCKGHAVYTANFTPPTSPLTVHYNSDGDETVLLCCQDSDNPLQEATGKTLIASGGLVEGDDTELVTNSGFVVDISGWTASGVQFTHSSGALMHFGNGNTQRNIYQDVTTVIGRKYVARVLASSAEANTAYWQVGPTDNMTTVGYIADNNNSAQLEYIYYFTATSTTTRIRFYSYDSGNSSNVRSYWYLASIKLVAKPIVPKVIPPFGVDAGNTFGGAISMNSPSWMYFPTGRTEERGRGRAVAWLGANNPSGSYTKDMDYFDIQSQGITTKFGEISDTVGLGAAMSSTTRGVFAGGTKPAAGNQNLLEFITIATTGNAIDFGSIGTLFRYGAGISNSTRGLIAGAYQGGGASGTKNVIQYITIANLGATADFGDMVANSNNGIYGAGSCQSSTRGITFGGGTGPSQIDEINYITIGTLGNSVDFGDISSARYYCQGLSSSTRGVVAGGQNPSSSTMNNIEFITIASTGDATDFGDLVTASQLAGSSGGSNKIRGVFIGGGAHPTYYNAMEFITIATTGNSSDFGDFSTGAGTPYGSVAASDSHGGLS